MLCDSCRFDPAAWTATDLRRTLDAVPAWAGHLAEGADADLRADLAPHLDRLAALPRGLDGAALLEAVHTAWHVLAEAGRVRHRHALPAHGTVAQVSASGGGVPKLPVHRARVTVRGLSGDRQGNRVHHGRPWQALCLWSAEVVEALAAEGHPVGLGACGENLSLRGLDWREVRPGLQLLVGTALLELTDFTIPCAKNARWFSDGRFRRIAHEVSPGTSRVYARVLVEGDVAVGDAVVVEPGALVPRQVVPVQEPLPLR